MGSARPRSPRSVALFEFIQGVLPPGGMAAKAPMDITGGSGPPLVSQPASTPTAQSPLGIKQDQAPLGLNDWYDANYAKDGFYYREGSREHYDAYNKYRASLGLAPVSGSFGGNFGTQSGLKRLS